MNLVFLLNLPRYFCDNIFAIHIGTNIIFHERITYIKIIMIRDKLLFDLTEFLPIISP